MALTASQQYNVRTAREDMSAAEKQFGFALRFDRAASQELGMAVDPTDALITLCSLYGLDIKQHLDRNSFTLYRGQIGVRKIYAMTTMKELVEWCVEASRTGKW